MAPAGREPDGAGTRPSRCGQPRDSRGRPRQHPRRAAARLAACPAAKAAGPAQAAGAGPAPRIPRASRGGRKPRGTGWRACGAEGVAMMTLGKPRGAATRATLGGIAAGLMIGLAACGNTVAGTGTAGTAVAGPGGPATAAHATPRPSPGAVNPGGVMIPASVPERAAMCRAIPKLTRMTFMRSTRPPDLHVREMLPAGFRIRDPATVRQLATLLC